MADINGGGAPEASTGEYRTFVNGGFGSLVMRPSPGIGKTPAVASRRGYLRGGLPAVYQEGDFGMRLIGALEAVLDPIHAILDALPAHFSPDHAPRDVLELLAAWLGVELDESQTVGHQREIVRRAAEIGRWRGTPRGLTLALELAFPDVRLRVEDQGGVRWSREERSPEATPRAFVVYCDDPVGAETQAAIARCIENQKPVGTSYRLRVRAAVPKDAS